MRSPASSSNGSLEKTDVNTILYNSRHNSITSRFFGLFSVSPIACDMTDILSSATFADELDSRQNAVITELEELNDRIERLLKECTRQRVEHTDDVESDKLA